MNKFLKNQVKLTGKNASKQIKVLSPKALNKLKGGGGLYWEYWYDPQ